MASPSEYTRRDGPALEHLHVGLRVSVPDWRRGTIVGWSDGVITRLSDGIGSFDAIVRLDSTGEEAGYWTYSVAYEGGGNF